MVRLGSIVDILNEDENTEVEDGVRDRKLSSVGVSVGSSIVSVIIEDFCGIFDAAVVETICGMLESTIGNISLVVPIEEGRVDELMISMILGSSVLLLFSVNENSTSELCLVEKDSTLVLI